MKPHSTPTARRSSVCCSGQGVYKQRNTQEVDGRALTHLQWDYVIETAEALAEEDLVPGRRIGDSGEVQT
ncbi:hypothetical protein [Pseudomonas monteilii]|uniref:hypothetical protein n=1 Tax=Pseudomonas monteilii TaxID=76759 RepID=UPI001E46446C|nr:hypothetical protein [Pseudomonas monteilii]